MDAFGWIQAVVFFGIVVALTKPLGAYMAAVFAGERTFASRLLEPIELAFYRACRIDARIEMTPKGYAFALLAFSAVGFVYLFALLSTQAWLPLNPQHVPNFGPTAAWNITVSFLTNTNWQFYSGESSMSYLSQMAGLAWHNFVSAAAGIAVAIAVVRGVARSQCRTLGNFWVDMTRAILYLLLPLSVVGALALCWQGVPQNFDRYRDVTSIEGFKQ